MPSFAYKRTSAGPFRADQVREGDPYELSNGHAVECMPGGERHGGANLRGGAVLATDPAVADAGVDVGCAFNEGKNLRAPDVAVGIDGDKPGWARQVPPLCVEVADVGQDEDELQAKVGELLAAGARHVWVVRLTGLPRVEAHEPGRRPRTCQLDDTLTAPGVLENPVPVRVFFEQDAAHEAMLRNLLQRRGFASLEALREKAQAEGRLEVLREAVADLCEAYGVSLGARRRAALGRMDEAALRSLRAHLKAHRAWPKR